MNRYLEIKIPFATKSFLNKKQVNENKDNKLLLKGNAIYIFDKNIKKIVDEYLVLEEANYRLTDAKMINTKYYKKINVINFRNNILDKITNHNPTSIEGNSRFNHLNKKDIKKINNYFNNLKTTIREQFSLLSGSNVSGAETNPKASPMVCLEQEYFSCNFANPIKKIIANTKEKTKEYKINVNDSINLKKFIELNSEFEQYFFEYNIWFYSDNYDPRVEKIKYNADLNNQLDDINNKISEYIQAYFNKNIANKNIIDHKKILRKFYTAGVTKGLRKELIPSCALLNDVNSAVIENAHIISFAKLVDINTEESLIKATDPFNVLRIDSNTHKMFDKNKITFDEFGNKIFREKNKNRIPFINIEKLNNRTLKYIEENYKYWKNENCNK